MREKRRRDPRLCTTARNVGSSDGATSPPPPCFPALRPPARRAGPAHGRVSYPPLGIFPFSNRGQKARKEGSFTAHRGRPCPPQSPSLPTNRTTPPTALTRGSSNCRRRRAP